MLYAVGAIKLAKPLVKLVAPSYTEQWSALAPVGVLMEEENHHAHLHR